MELREALSQIDTIHAQMAQTVVFRGYRSVSVGASGVFALVAVLVQWRWIPNPQQEYQSYLVLWISVAALSILVVGAEMVIRRIATRSRLGTYSMRSAIEQIVPSIVAGGIVTAVICSGHPNQVWMLPGLWAIFFSLGIFASCRLQPPLILGVGFYYLLAGTACLAVAHNDLALAPWTMAATFGVGQLATSAILYFTLERNSTEPDRGQAD